MDTMASSIIFFFLVSFLMSFHRALPSKNTNNEISAAPPVRLFMQSNQAVMDNGIVKVTLSSPGGLVMGIRYNGIDNILATSATDKYSSGYWDCDWESGTGSQPEDRQLGAKLRIISNTTDQLEISFGMTWYKGSPFPMNVDKRFIMLRGSSGFYTYAIYEHLEGWPRVTINNMRIVFKLKENQFKYMAISDKRQKIMPTGAERADGTVLAYKEAVLLKNGEVDDKYQYTSDNKDSHLHGWIADTPSTGFWMITPSDEFRVGGPFRQDLTSHTAATTLSIFVSSHYAGQGFGIYIKDGEPWKKVFGPIFIYLNSVVDKEHRPALWQNAKSQMLVETKNWPYNFPLSVDYLKADQRGILFGQLEVSDRYINKYRQQPPFLHVGLALLEEVGSWETEYKGYQFWANTDKRGGFVINSVRPGIYNLYAWAPGVVGEYKYRYPIKITQGSTTRLTGLVFEPPRSGPTIWEIGFPDRQASEFYVPDVDPPYANHLYDNFDRFRQYGMWQRYTDLHPKDDITYTVGKSNYSRDWFFAHVLRMNGNLTATTWTIIFQLGTVAENQNYTLRIAFASATYGKLRIAVNNGSTINTIGPLGKDNAIARHGIHGLYHLAEVTISSRNLAVGKNSIHLTLVPNGYLFTGFMYDYIRFEGPPN